MDAIVEFRVKTFLYNWLHYRPQELGTAITKMRDLAQMSGHALNDKFAAAGLGAGPEARLASRIVNRAMVGGSGTEVSDYEMRKTLDRWIHMGGMGKIV